MLPDSSFEIILGTPWLRSNRPSIDWDNFEISFLDGSIYHLQPLSIELDDSLQLPILDSVSLSSSPLHNSVYVSEPTSNQAILNSPSPLHDSVHVSEPMLNQAILNPPFPNQILFIHFPIPYPNPFHYMSARASDTRG